MKIKYLANLVILAACISFIVGCGEGGPSGSNAGVPIFLPKGQSGSSEGVAVAHLQLIEAQDVRSGKVTGIKLHLRLTCDKNETLKIHANELSIDRKKGDSVCNWDFLNFFSNAKAKSFTMTTLQIDDGYYNVGRVDYDAELILDLKAGLETEAEILFFGLDKSQAKSFHFGANSAIKIR